MGEMGIIGVDKKQRPVKIRPFSFLGRKRAHKGITIFAASH